MEDELIAQRDAAIAVTKELQRQLQQHREVVERTIERRALNAERLRFHAEEQLRRANEERDWEAVMCSRLLSLSLFGGALGAIIGWIVGLFVFVLVAQPVVGFLLILPGMASGTILGLGIAKTRIQLDSRRRLAKRRRSSRHAEVELAVSGAVATTPEEQSLEPLQGVSDGVLQEAAMVAPASIGGSGEMPGACAQDGSTATKTTWLGLAWMVTAQTWRTSRDLATGLYHSTDYVRGALAGGNVPPTTMDEHDTKKRS